MGCCCISSCLFFTLSSCIYYIFVFIVCVNVSYFVSVYVSMCDRIRKTNRLARKTNFFFIALLPFTSSEDAAVQI